MARRKKESITFLIRIISALKNDKNPTMVMKAIARAVNVVALHYGSPSLFYREECGDFILRSPKPTESPLDYQI